MGCMRIPKPQLSRDIRSLYQAPVSSSRGERTGTVRNLWASETSASTKSEASDACPMVLLKAIYEKGRRGERRNARANGEPSVTP